MDKDLIQSVLEDYLQLAYRSGNFEEQDRIIEAMEELNKKEE